MSSQTYSNCEKPNASLLNFEKKRSDLTRERLSLFVTINFYIKNILIVCFFNCIVTNPQSAGFGYVIMQQYLLLN